MSRVTVANLGGKTLVELDLSGCVPDVSIPAIKDAMSIIKTFPRNSVLLLTNVTEAVQTKDVVNCIKDFAVSNTPYVKASAVLGIDAEKKPVLATVQFLTLHEIRSFSDEADAREWLNNFLN